MTAVVSQAPGGSDSRMFGHSACDMQVDVGLELRPAASGRILEHWTCSLSDANVPLYTAGLSFVDSMMEHLALGLNGALRQGCGSTGSEWTRSCSSRPLLVVDLF